MAETLEPSLVDDMGGLLSALQSQAVRFEQASRGRLVVRVEGGPLHGLPAEIEYAAYRMACEALTNVARHARARHCTVRLTVVGGCLQLEVTDDGKGLPRAPKPGLGLASMAERARELGGDCVIERRTPNGTRVLGRLPTVPPQR
jgi:signal transduction histidine kinase